MSRIFRFASTLSALIAATASAQALDPELTMRPIGNVAVELPAPVSEILALPDVASSVALERSAVGLARANENRARGSENREAALANAAERREAGLSVAADARERGAELGAEIAESARSLRESLVRGHGPVDVPIPVELPELPEHVLPDRPDVPAPPVELPDRPDVPAPVELPDRPALP